MLKQIDLNVLRPEDQRLDEIYPGDSINWTIIRLHFDECDASAVMQMVKDHKIRPCIWSWTPKKSHLSTPWWKRISNKIHMKTRLWKRVVQFFGLKALEFGN